MQRHALITGATGGLGQAVVQRFARAGYRVTLVDLQPEPPEGLPLLAEAAELPDPAELSYRQVNILDTEARQALASNIPQLDVLVNLIGGFQMGAFEELTQADLERMLQLNLYSSLGMSQSFLPQLKASAAGRIVNVGARQALAGGALVSAYALSKAAVVNLTQSLAQELLDTSVTVNAVLPSTLDTPANRAGMPDADFQRWVQPADLAEVICFLASPEARAVSGAVVPVYHKA